jgi:Domain of unknown function DUF29
MEELDQLRKYLVSGQYDAALLLLDEMEEMSRDDKITRIASFMEILLLHLIKQEVEQRTTPSWERSIHNALRAIVRLNKRRKAGGYYLTDAELQATLEETFDDALYNVSFEARGGQHSVAELGDMIDRRAALQRAFELLQHMQQTSS